MVVDEAFTLRNFIAGASNKRAIERLRRGTSNPVLLLGPSGVGKSHLLQAMASRVGPRGPRLLAVRAHEFQARYVDAIYAGSVAEFRSWLRTHKVLIVDELEDLIRYESALAELSKFVCELIAARGRVYLASTKLWPALFDALATWDADVVPIERPSLAQRTAAVARRARRRLTLRKLAEIARSSPTIGGALAALDRELLASAIADA